MTTEYTACSECGCKARHTPDTSTPGINWCHRCRACCWTAEAPKIVLGTRDFGYGWAGSQLRALMRKGK